MIAIRFRVAAIVGVLALAAAAGRAAEPRVRLEIVFDRRAPLTAQQEWAKRLGQAGMGDVRLRGDGADEKVRVESQGTPDDPVYFVLGKVDSQGQLQLPGGRFSMSQTAGVAQWMTALVRRGPNPKPEPKSVLGLPADQFQAVYDALAAPVSFSTKGMARTEAIRKIAALSQMPIPIEAAVGRVGDEEAEKDLVAEELKDVACGTALACVLRPAGLCLKPDAADGRAQLRVVQSQRDIEIWPIGWKSNKPDAQVLRAMFDTLDPNIENVPLGKVVDVIGGRLKVPVLWDHNALARHDIDPAKVRVNAPQSRTTYQALLRRVLAQAKLIGELRLDEAGHPIFWVTTLIPL